MNLQTRYCLLLAAGLAGCAAQPQPIVDLQGVNRAQYESDLADCQDYADDVRKGRHVTAGAAAGAVVGAAIGSIEGRADRGAGYGGIVGAARGGGRAERTEHRVLRRCLAGRGYRVLD